MKGAVVDVDGTVLRGETLIEGAREGIAALRDARVRIVFFSNNPTTTSDDLKRRLRDAGIKMEDATPLTSATLTARYVAENCASPAHVTGEEAVVEALSNVGVTVTDKPTEARTAVVSVDRRLRYDDIRDGYVAARAADDYVCTDPDAVVPATDGDIPGSGAVEAAVSRAAGRQPVVVGKPSEFAAEAVLDALGTSPDETLFVGDRLDTDIALGESVGATTAVVLTGITDENDLSASEHRPDYVLDTFADVRDLL
ncbi:MAG: HAD-IIA family hydrolase [Halobacteriales archaeon]|nr:HAD-IIA family hydrolase [Halobacteriales archaeon]